MHIFLDFMKANSALSVTCSNCFHETRLTARFLNETMGINGRVVKLYFTGKHTEQITLKVRDGLNSGLDEFGVQNIIERIER